MGGEQRKCIVKKSKGKEEGNKQEGLTRGSIGTGMKPRKRQVSNSQARIASFHNIGSCLFNPRAGGPFRVTFVRVSS